jgi:hypothetical protein
MFIVYDSYSVDSINKTIILGKKMFKKSVSVLLLFSLSAFAQESLQSKMQRLQTVSKSERFQLMNEIKRELVTLHGDQRREALGRLRKHLGHGHKNGKHDRTGKGRHKGQGLGKHKNQNQQQRKYKNQQQNSGADKNQNGKNQQQQHGKKKPLIV